MLAYSYIRFSTPEQLKGDSLRRQLELSEKYVAEKGLTLDTTIKMRDLGLSAFDKSNVTKGALGGFLKAIEQGRIPKGSYLLVEHLDRLSRAEVLDALGQFISILSAGITIVTLLDPVQEYSYESVNANPMLLLITISMMAGSHDESKKKVKRLSEVWGKKLDAVISDKKVLTTQVPLWLTVKDKKKLELIPERAEVVRRVFQLAKDGVGQLSIAKILNSDTPYWGRSGSWQESYIIKILKNHAVYGAIKIRGELVEGYYPPVISRDEFLFVTKLRQDRRVSKAGNKKGSRLSNLFSGLVYCGYCGSSMVMSGSTVANQEQKYLVCKGARVGSTDCKCVNWNYLDIETIFLFRCANLNLSMLFGETKSEDMNKLESQKTSIIVAIEDMTHKIENLYRAIENEFHQGLMDRIKKYETEIGVLDKQLSDVESAIAVKRHASNSSASRMSYLLKLFKALTKTQDESELRIIRESVQGQIKDIVKRIELYPTGPALNKAEREMRFMKVHFESGTIEEWD